MRSIENGREDDRFILPITSVIEWALRLNPGARDRPYFESECDQLDLIVDGVRGTSLFRRLAWVKACATTRSALGRALEHSRADHSVAVAGTALAIAWRVDLPLLETERLVVAALLHDVGHSMFSHQGEHVIGEKTGGHEAVGRDLILEDEELSETLARLGVNARAVIDIVAERGPIGTVMSISDSCGYLCLDSIGLGYTDFGFEEAGRFIRNGIRGVREDLLVVNDVREVRTFLNTRAQRYIDSYVSLCSRRRESALVALLRIVADDIGMDEFVGIARLGRDHEFWPLLPWTEEVSTLVSVYRGEYPEEKIRRVLPKRPRPVPPPRTVVLPDPAFEKPFDKTLIVGVLGSKGEIETVRVTRTIEIPEELRNSYVHYIDL